MLQAIFQFF